jgi:MOSC domain-containing protein YiiM
MSDLRVISINIGAARPMAAAKVTGTTGIYKSPVEGAVEITALGLSGDAVCDTKNHGGPDQAVYLYGQRDYDWWSAELGQALPAGTFGENLTIDGLASADLSIGDRLRIGSVVLEVAAPRIPCHVLAARMDDPQFVKRFKDAARPGAYCRVIVAGAISAGTPVALTPHNGPTLPLVEMFAEYYAPALTNAQLARQQAAPIAARFRAGLAKKSVLDNG